MSVACAMAIATLSGGAAMPEEVATKYALDEQDIAAAELAAEIFIEIYHNLGSTQGLNWYTHIMKKVWGNKKVEALYARYVPEKERDFRSSEHIVSRGLSTLVRIGMITLDDVTEDEDLYFPTETLAKLFCRN